MRVLWAILRLISNRRLGYAQSVFGQADEQSRQPKLLRPEPVTDVTVCQKIPRFRRIGFKLLPQVTNYNAQPRTIRALLCPQSTLKMAS
jgi:hypothetical protein